MTERLMGIVMVICLLMSTKVQAQSDNLKNLPEYSLPISNKKLIIAHCMTNIIRYKGHEIEDSGNPKYYSPEGNITAPLGGLTQVNVLSDSFLKDKTLDEAVEFEMRAAKLSGIDGFQFYYILGNRHWDEIIKAYFRVADQKGIDFKFSLCISHPAGQSEDQKIAEFAERINGILKEVGRDNSHWLRTPDGRLITYLWYGEQLADVPANSTLPKQYYYARAFDKLGKAIKEKLACIFTINERLSENELNNWLDYFPATWVWTLPYKQDYFGKLVSERCIARKRNFTGSAFCDFYTSKLLKKGTWDMYHTAQEAINAGLKNVERKYIATGLSYNFRKLLEFGIEQDAQIINIITWNDYPEGHHLAPEINRNDGFSILLKYYKSIWKNEPSPYHDKDVAIAFFKKYTSDVKPKPFNIHVDDFEKEAIPQPVEDSIEVITILPDKAVLSVNGQSITTGKGLTSTRFKSEPGAVTVKVMRNEKSSVSFTAPEWITKNPYRTDRLTYTFSSEFSNYYKTLFGNVKPVYSIEYNSDLNKAQFPVKPLKN